MTMMMIAAPLQDWEDLKPNTNADKASQSMFGLALFYFVRLCKIPIILAEIVVHQFQL